MEKVIKRGYVKWTDEFGVFRKEPLYKHPELLASASSEDQIAAEEARRLNEAAEFYEINRLDEVHDDQEKTLEALKAAPEEVVVASQLAVDEKGDPIPEAAEIVTSADYVIEAPELTGEDAKAVTNDPDSDHDGDSAD